MHDLYAELFVLGINGDLYEDSLELGRSKNQSEDFLVLAVVAEVVLASDS